MNVRSKALQRFLTESSMEARNIFDLIVMNDTESKEPRLQSTTNSLEDVSWYQDGYDDKKGEHNTIRPPPKPRSKPPPLPKTPVPSRTWSMHALPGPNPGSRVQNLPNTVLPRAKWAQVRQELLEEERKLRIQVESLAKRRRNLPWVKVTKDYQFTGKGEHRNLEELFEGKDELRLYHIARSHNDCEKWYRWVDAVRQTSKV